MPVSLFTPSFLSNSQQVLFAPQSARGLKIGALNCQDDETGSNLHFEIVVLEPGEEFGGQFSTVS